MSEKCDRCDGCGQIANSDEGEPWTFWTSLPVHSAAAMLMGLVEPIPCPECGGSGSAASSEGKKSEPMNAEELAFLLRACDGIESDTPDGELPVIPLPTSVIRRLVARVEEAS